MVGESTRRYSSTRRADQAAQTRAQILAAAAELFLRDGWRATTIAAVAARAGVVIDTIYAGFGSKAGLLAAAKSAARDTDETDVPFFERASFVEALRAGRSERPARFADLLATVNERTWRLDLVWRDAAAFEPSVRAQWTERELGRRAQFARALELLTGEPPDRATVDTIWVLTGSDVYAKLVGDAGLTPGQYVEWLTASLHLLLGDSAVSSAGTGGTGR